MKIFKLFASIWAFALLAAGCETYDDMEVDHSPVFPLSGEWVVNIYNSADGEMIPDGDGYTLNTYNTSSNEKDVMWVFLSTAKNPFGVKGKVGCNVEARTFAGSNVTGTLGGEVFTVTDGKVVLDSYTTNSGGKADEISFLLKTNKSDITYLIKGFRRTGWDEDE